MLRHSKGPRKPTVVSSGALRKQMILGSPTWGMRSEEKGARNDAYEVRPAEYEVRDKNSQI